ncbi:calcium-dependent phosphotriesterase [Aspergillus sclerotiicarbonarius CBS 121057]|uniref:Calcium-dependent phosphotriesterase n=1 Tax=Aspergillus sclerotiicarbonarius (strain CBS 121057 / IBT 28362) TaxID=1448318 RepID=A0A319EB84_ASPSB|nr:calcium-dependent phosphotriesterase [Aspergillus sclerotiicarbonarius CBS 121057]
MTKSTGTGFHTHQQRFEAIVGTAPTLELLAEHHDYPFAHEAGVFIAETNSLFITSNRCHGPDGQRKVHITRVDLSTNPVTYEEIATDVPMANGGVNYGKDVLFCGQGSMTQPGGLYRMSATAPYESELLVGDFHGRPFNSVNDVVVHSDGSIWFTDPIYGFEQGFRPSPRLPSQVYRWCPQEGTIRAMADNFGRPNGICFSPDEKVVYVTDTDREHGDGTIDDQRASTIYAFDISVYHGQPFLTNRRLFAMADHGIPDGIKCDLNGNVYSGCGDGIHVWSPGGVLVGRILIEGGVANFCFGRNGEIFALNEHRIWRAQLGTEVKGALLGL